MSESIEVALDFVCIAPVDLLQIGQGVPVDEEYDIPIRVFGREFSIVEPTLGALGGGAVALSLERSFGFMRIEEDGKVLRSQKTDGITLDLVANTPEKWQAILKTQKPLSEQDRALFITGIRYYAVYAATKSGRVSSPNGLRLPS